MRDWPAGRLIRNVDHIPDGDGPVDRLDHGTGGSCGSEQVLFGKVGDTVIRGDLLETSIVERRQLSYQLTPSTDTTSSWYTRPLSTLFISLSLLPCAWCVGALGDLKLADRVDAERNHR
jgi:hypothetical protein